MIFLLTVLAAGLAFFLLFIASKMISGSLVKPISSKFNYKEDYNEIDATDIVHNGGGVQ